jgi:uncharacterized damage-inducible protein DinB
MNIGAAYLDEARRSLRGHKRLAEGAFTQLTDEEFFRAPDPESNSVAVIAKHIAGNQRSRFTDFLTSDGEKPDRHRDQEFELTAGTGREEVMRWWESAWKIVLDAIAALQPEDLERTVTIRGEPHTVLQAIHRATAHMAYHVGQIVFLAKQWRGANWKSLSIPRGQSEEFNARKLQGTAGPQNVLEKNKADALDRTKFP